MSALLSTAVSSALLPALLHGLLHALWQTALLALCAAATLHALRHHSAAARHTAGMAWLLAMPLVPLMTALDFLANPPAPLQTNAGFVPGQTTMVAVPALWLLGVFMMAALRVRDWRALLRLEHERFMPLPEAWTARVAALRRRMGIAAQVQVRVVRDCGASPFTARLLRPIVWLPLAVLTHLPPDQVAALLAHELAHIRRKDWLWNGLQCAVEALLFFHPAMWWLSRRIRQERENACDDLAVAAGEDPIALAEGLTALQKMRQAEIRRPMPAFALAAGGGVLLARVTRILGAPAGRPLGMRTLGALVAALFAALLLAYGAPRQDASGTAADRGQAVLLAAFAAPADETTMPAQPAPPVQQLAPSLAVIHVMPVPPERPTLRQAVPVLSPPPPRPTIE